MNSNNKIAATLYTVFPKDIVCLRNISINTLHKGEDDDDDDDDDNNNNNNNVVVEAQGPLAEEDQVQSQASP